MMLSDARLNACIEGLYEALASPHKLEHAIRTVRLSFGASGATHLRLDRHRQLMAFVDDGHDPAAQRLYVDHYVALDPTRSLWDLRPGQWLRDDRVLDPRHTLQPEFVNDFAPKIGMRWFLGCKLFENEAGVASFSLQRAHDAPPFDDETFASIRVLQPHLARVFRLLMEVAPVLPSLAAGEAALNAIDNAICVVDADARLLYANPAALRRFGSSALTVGAGCVRCADPGAHAMLRKALLLACRPPRRASVFSAADERSPVRRLQVRVLPLHEHTLLQSYARGDLALLMFAEGPTIAATGELQELHGLTRAEAELLRMVAEGRSPEACARMRGVSVATVRTQLKSIRSKTGATSQAQLASLAAALPAMRAGAPAD